MIASLRFTNASNNRPWRVDIVESDDSRAKNHPYTVKFYDLSFPEKFGAKGQFVSDYYAGSLLQNEGKEGWPYAISLHGGIPEWNIGAKEFAAVIDFIKESLSQED